MNTNELLTALNQLDRDRLTALSGIGPALAERILAARPFETLDQVQAVKGIRSTLVQKLLDEEPASPPDPEPAPVQEADVLPEAAVNDETPLAEKEDKKREPAPHPRAPLFDIREKTVGWGNLSAYILTSIASIILTLAILGGINGGLLFASRAEQQAASQKFTQLSRDVETLQKNVGGLRSRVDTLDGLSNRTKSIEQNQTELADALDAATKELSALQGELETLNQTVSQQDERTLRFEDFLASLQENLNSIFSEGAAE